MYIYDISSLRVNRSLNTNPIDSGTTHLFYRVCYMFRQIWAVMKELNMKKDEL